jgi:catalase (peroxidase I)
VLLTTVKWTRKKWMGPEQYQDPHDELMMLPTDMALLWDDKFKVHVLEFAKNRDAFYDAFSAAFSKLLELGISTSSKL